MKTKKRVLILDANNLFIMSYVVNPSISTAGYPVGGLVGFLTKLQKLCREMKPDDVIFCWDGKGGSARKKINNSAYKDGRSPIRLNRNINNLNPQEELDNKIWQMTRTVEYLNMMPMVQLMFDGVEADDLIAYVSNHPFYSDYNKIIVSNDKDFIQLCDDSIIVYRPTKEELVTRKTVLQEYNIHPNNFALARALAGDVSDNLEGIEGVGLKTVAKRFPFMSEDKAHTTKDLIDFSRQKIEEKTKIKVFQSVLDNEKKILQNYQIMQLYSPTIPVQDKQKITYTVSNFEYQLNKTEFIRQTLLDGFGHIRFDELFACCNRIISEHKKE